MKTAVFFLIGCPIGMLFTSAIYRARDGDAITAAWHMFNCLCLMAAGAILIFWLKI